MEALAKVGDFALLPPEVVLVEESGAWFNGNGLRWSGNGRPPKDFEGYAKTSRYLDDRWSEDPVALLSEREYLALALSFTGIPISEIGKEMEITPNGARKILAKEAVKEARLHILDTVAEAELAGLVTKAIDAYRQGLRSSDIDIKMKAADRILKALGKDARKTQDEPSTATKDLNAVLTSINNLRANNVQINIGGKYGQD